LLIAVIADTHLPRGNRRLPDRCAELIAGSELVLHAGDVMTAEALAGIEALGTPVAAVHGNVDTAELRRLLPAERIVEVGGARIGLVHDAGPAAGRIERLRRRFPDADAVVFGHSHLPLHEESDDFQIFNPGSPVERRRAKRHTMGLARAQNGRVEFELIALD
jgi:putative phosphoesterase